MSNYQHKFEVEAECKSCNGTGIYVGIAEHCGAGVVCHTCKGTGKVKLNLEWNDFHCRRIRSGIERVYRVNPGIVIGTGKGHTLDQFGGMPYEDWLRDDCFSPGSEMREFTCPAWYYQSAQYELKPDWPECTHSSFPHCEHFGNKRACWARWDREQDTSDD
jgi:hypothetical protein